MNARLQCRRQCPSEPSCTPFPRVPDSRDWLATFGIPLSPMLTFSQFDIFSSITLITITVIGESVTSADPQWRNDRRGLASVPRSSVILRHHQYFTLVLGVLLLVQLTLLPDGVASNITTTLDSFGRRTFRHETLREARIRFLRDQGIQTAGARAARHHRDIRNCSRPYRRDLSVQPGEVVVFIGPNGAGKTTLIDWPVDSFDPVVVGSL